MIIKKIYATFDSEVGVKRLSTHLRSSIYPGMPPRDNVYDVMTEITRKYRNIWGHSLSFWHLPIMPDQFPDLGPASPTQVQLEKICNTVEKSPIIKVYLIKSEVTNLF